MDSQKQPLTGVLKIFLFGNVLDYNLIFLEVLKKISEYSFFETLTGDSLYTKLPTQ